MQHDTLLALIDFVKSALAFGSSSAVVATIAMRRRGKQNHKLAERLAIEVRNVQAEVKKVTNGLESIQALTAIHTDKINDSNERISELTLKIDEIEHLLPELENVMKGVRSYFERAKQQAMNLKEEPIAGSGGKVALKSKKEGT